MRRTYLVTGANSGLGRATAARLAATGAQVVIVCRDKRKGETARDEIKSQSNNESVDLLEGDLSLMSDVRRLVSEFAARYPKLDVLTNNAGVFLNSRVTTSDGHEKMFATNYLGPFLLTRLLVPYLEAARPARVVNVTAPSTTRPDLDNLDGERKFSAIGSFGASKAADLLFTYALAKRVEEKGITVNAYHPGIVRTNLNRTAPSPVRLIGGIMNLFVGAPPDVAAEGLFQLATSVEFERTNGLLIHKGHAISAPFVDDEELQDRLWTSSCALLGLSQTV